MISNYSKPQLLIKQLLEVLPDQGEQDLNATIIGPQYDLMRVSNADEKATMTGAAFVRNTSVQPEDRQVLEYENKTAGSEVDIASVRLYGENLEGQLAVFGDGAEVGAVSDDDYFIVDNLQTPEVLRFVNDDAAGTLTGLNLSGEVVDGEYVGLHESLHGSPIRSGDIAYITLGSTTSRRTVREVRREYVASSFGSEGTDGNAANSDINPVDYKMDGSDPISDPVIKDGVVPDGITLPEVLVGWNGLIRGAKYQNKYGDRFTISVTSSASHNGTDDTANVSGRCQIRSASGTYSADDVAITASGLAGTFTLIVDGVSLVLTTADNAYTLQIGSIIAFTVLAAYERLDTSTDNAKDIELQGNYTGTRNTTYSIKVVKGSISGYTGAVVQVYDSAGLDRVIQYTLVNGTWFGLGTLGLQFRFTDTVAPVQNGLRTGDIYYVQAKARQATGPYSLLVLNSASMDVSTWDDEDRRTNALKVEFRRAYTGYISDKGNKAPIREWEATQKGVYLAANMVMLDNTRYDNYKWLTVEESSKSKLFVSYKALRPAAQNEKYVKIRSASDITRYFGKVDLENPIAYGCMKALGGSQGKYIYAIRVPSDNVAGYTEALRILEASSLFYSLSVMSYDVDVHNALLMHVEAMSQEDTKKWRRGYVGSITPENYAVMQEDSEGEPRTATILPLDGMNVRVYDENGAFQTYGVGYGDILRTNFSQDSWGEETYEEYVIKEVSAEEEVLLETGPVTAISPAARYEIWRNNNAANVVKFIKARSSQYGSRRLVNVWSDTPLALNSDNAFFEVPMYYVAAEIAGLRSAVLPQQGLTRTEVESVSAIPSMYTKYTEDQLNAIAAEGTFIIVQEVEDGPRFIRHQLTTDTKNGAMYYEDSVGTNFDDISYACKQVLEKYIGKRNTNPSTLRDIYRDVEYILRTKMEEIPGIKIGPQLIGFTDLKVWVDKNLKDRVNIYAKLEFPLPINTIELTLNATASFNDAVIDATNIVES